MWGVLDGKVLLGERCVLSAEEESGVAEAEVDDSTDGSGVCTDNCGGDSFGSRVRDCVDISRVPAGRAVSKCTFSTAFRFASCS